MKLINSFWLGQTTGETIATFGAARLVKKLDGKIELVGGTAGDHADAHEWCSMFAPANRSEGNALETIDAMVEDTPIEASKR